MLHVLYIHIVFVKYQCKKYFTLLGNGAFEQYVYFIQHRVKILTKNKNNKKQKERVREEKEELCRHEYIELPKCFSRNVTLDPRQFNSLKPIFNVQKYVTRTPVDFS